MKTTRVQTSQKSLNITESVMALRQPKKTLNMKMVSMNNIKF